MVNLSDLRASIWKEHIANPSSYSLVGVQNIKFDFVQFICKSVLTIEVLSLFHQELRSLLPLALQELVEALSPAGSKRDTVVGAESTKSTAALKWQSKSETMN